MFALFQVVVQPVSEMGLTPNREFRSEYLHSSFTSTTPVVWNVIVVGTQSLDLEITTLIHSVAMVDACWSFEKAS